jgi:hypothetical protein
LEILQRKGPVLLEFPQTSKGHLPPRAGNARSTTELLKADKKGKKATKILHFLQIFSVN